MKSGPLHVEPKSSTSRFTHLFARISEDEDGCTVLVRLYNQMTPENAAWGEEIAGSFETASMLVATLASEFSIPEGCVKIEIRMHNSSAGTKH